MPRQHLTHDISIHALREEGDLMVVLIIPTFKKFQSTPSARRATLVYGRQRRGKLISIHALREESDSSRDTRSAQH